MRYLSIIICLCMTVQVVSQDLSQLYEEVNPAVVVIFTQEKKLEKKAGTTQLVRSQSLGSGFLISATQVITAAHVVDIAELLFVQFTDGKILEAKVVSTFKDSDVALIELLTPKENPVIVKLGDSDTLKVGEQVFVVGAPFGLAHSLSSGYVSGIVKNSESADLFSKSEYIQTDAAINTGNSGGPMFNLKGEVMGVVSHIKSVNGGFQGIGFAASSNIAKKLLLDQQVLWTGADLLPVYGKKAKMLNIPQQAGLLVQIVVPTSLFGKMGLRGGDVEAIIDGNKLILGGDIILAFNGIKFDFSDETLNELSAMASARKEGDPLVLKVLRHGKIIEFRN